MMIQPIKTLIHIPNFGKNKIENKNKFKNNIIKDIRK